MWSNTLGRVRVPISNIFLKLPLTYEKRHYEEEPAEDSGILCYKQTDLFLLLYEDNFYTTNDLYKFVHPFSLKYFIKSSREP